MKCNAMIVLGGLCMMGSAQAQSSVTLFGTLDAGITYVSNEGGHGNLKFDDGINVPNYLGITGSEDLGGGTRATFKLVGEFILGNGSILPGEGLFGQEAYVGLENTRYGTIRFGEQHNFMTEALLLTGTDGVLYGGGFYNFRNGPFDKLAIPENPTGAMSWDRMNGVPVNNAVKYISPTFGGFSFGAVYGFGNVAGSISQNNEYNFCVMYRNGGLSGGAAYMSQRYSGSEAGNPQIRIENWGAGLRYMVGSVGFNGLFTTVKNKFTGAAAYMGEVGTTWQPSPFWLLLADYMYMKGNGELNNNHAHQVTAAVTYFLSKRTSIYAEGVYQRANSGAQAQINYVFTQSSSPSQAIARLGVTMLF